MPLSKSTSLFGPLILAHSLTHSFPFSEILTDIADRRGNASVLRCKLEVL